MLGLFDWSLNFLNFSLLFSTYCLFALLSVRFSYLITHPFHLFLFLLLCFKFPRVLCVCECSFFLSFYIIFFSFRKFNTNFSSLMIFMVVFSGRKGFYSPCMVSVSSLLPLTTFLFWSLSFKVRGFHQIIVMLGSLFIYWQTKELTGNSESMSEIVEQELHCK